jgi:hypothetical protein
MPGRVGIFPLLLLALVAIIGMMAAAGHTIVAPRILLSMLVFAGYFIWQERKAARDPDFAAREAARSRVQQAFWMFFLAVLGGVVLLGLVVHGDPQLELALMPYMEAGPLLLVVCGAPLFVLWRMRSR